MWRAEIDKLTEAKKVNRLISKLATGLSDWDITSAAAEGLGVIGEPAVAPLIKTLEDEEIRNYAAMALGFTRSKNAVEPLVTMLDDESFTTRFFAVEALGRIGDTRAREPLSQLLKNKDEDEDVVQAVHEALAKL